MKQKVPDIIAVILTIVVGVGLLFVTIAGFFAESNFTDNGLELLKSFYIAILAIISLYIGSRIRENKNF